MELKKMLQGFSMALSMFSVLPAPMVWEEKALRWVIPMFPVVGIIIGGLWYGVWYLLAVMKVPMYMSAVLLFVFLSFITGFIHMDGYMDTSDAIGSRTSLERKKQILKDSHVGAFAVIACAVYFLLGSTALYSGLEVDADMRILLFIPIFSRCISGTFLLSVSTISDSGYGADFKRESRWYHRMAVFSVAILCLVISFYTGGMQTGIPLVVMLAGGIISGYYVIRQMKGISGDLCGFILTVSELCGLCALPFLYG